MFRKLVTWWQGLSKTSRRRLMYVILIVLMLDFLDYVGITEAKMVEDYETRIATLSYGLGNAEAVFASKEKSYRECLQKIVNNLYEEETYGTGGYEVGGRGEIDVLYETIMNATVDFSDLLENTENYFDERKEYMALIPSIWPVKYDSTIRITSGFGNRIYPMTGKVEFHQGIDIAGDWMTEIIATADGTVTDVWIRHPVYGKMVVVKHRDGFITLYAHMSRTVVREKMEIKQGKVLGAMGNTGQSRGRHLHYEVQKESKLVNPIEYLSSNRILIMSK